MGINRKWHNHGRNRPYMYGIIVSEEVEEKGCYIWGIYCFSSKSTWSGDQVLFPFNKGREALCRVVDQVGDYKILKASRGYVVKNINGSYDNHGHFRKLGTCYKIIKMVQRKQVPNSKYLRESAIRLSLDDRYIDRVRRKIEKDRDKQKYINSQKGVRI